MTQQVISIEEARKILGKKYDKLTDEEIEQLIINLDSIAREFIRQRVRELTNQQQVINPSDIIAD